MSGYKAWAMRMSARHDWAARWVFPPSPGGWFAPFYLRWVPVPLRYGWVHSRFRCVEPGCWRSWTWDNACRRHAWHGGD